MPENTPPRSSERLWSEEVGLANADNPPKKDVAYEWSNGRTFEDGNGVYEVPA